MTYKHPEKYQGERLSHESACRFVEDKCMKCDRFMGNDHNFEDCRKDVTNRDGITIKILDCGNVPDSCKRFQDRAIIQQRFQLDLRKLNKNPPHEEEGQTTVGKGV